MRCCLRFLFAAVLSFSSGVSSAAPPKAPGASTDYLSLSLDVERKSRTQDIRDLDRLSRELERLEKENAGRRGQMTGLLERAELDVNRLRDTEEDLAEAEARLRVLQDLRRAAAARIVEKTRKIALLSDEIRRRRTGTDQLYPDPISGTWIILVNPQSRKGEMRLTLDGTLVWGEYLLDGGFRGSVRGTYVGEKISLQRIDSERGADANFYGRVTSQKRITGTWESTLIAPSIGPSGGTWSATMAQDPEDEVSSPPQKEERK